MATKRMLVDATHPEETRIVVTSGNKLEEFDFESASHKQLRGNIYLAKVTRVEPSLQAAFVDYGGNRHGFLAFSEIHPDYYQIPVADREALLKAEAEAHAESEKQVAEADDAAAEVQEPEDADAPDTDDDGDEIPAGEAETVADGAGSTEDVEAEGDELQSRRKTQVRRYKIQEVIKRRQVMLVQVVKEERGNKGAALTTYLSLAGRYSVLMPNTARGGGISRKITSAADRKRLKEIAGELDVPQGMGVILRTAGASRTKAEVKRDFEYLSRLWENVRTLTMQSTAPCLVYEEGSLIKRTIRDLYDKDISEIVVAGSAAHKEAREFMKLILPSHAKKVKLHTDSAQIFTRNNVEPQLDSMFSPQVTLPSGGYIVINPTEALVSIDVNSGRATREHNIEDTALQTNLEAADEVARQLRLRDLAGLIVIDFIDMTERRSIRNVEKRMKDALKNDRARIQIGRISHFGLMEMSRQRMRFGVLESSTHTCPTCHGSGIVRSVESLALMVLRAIEDKVMRQPGQSVEVKVPTDVALYLLNSKRNSLIEIEARYNLAIVISADDTLTGVHYAIEKSSVKHEPIARIAVGIDTAPAIEADEDEDDVVDEAEDESEDETEAGAEASPAPRRRRRRGGRNRQDNRSNNDSDDSETSEDEDAEKSVEARDGDEDGQPRKRRRRGRRGGRRNRRPQDADANQSSDEVTEGAAAEAVEGKKPEAAEEADEEKHEAAEALDKDQKSSEAAPAKDSAEEEPKKPARRRSRKKKTDDVEAKDAEAKADPAEKAEEPAAQEPEPAPEPEPEPEPVAAEAPAKPSRKKELPEEGVIVTSSGSENAEPPKKGGWWQRRLGR